MGIELEIFYHTDETLSMSNLDVTYSLLECDTQMRTFYWINAISPIMDKVSGEWFCKIFYNGTDAVCINTYEEVKELINKHFSK